MAEPGEPPLVVLASASPRRLDLLRRLGVQPEVRPADVDESALDGEDPDDHVVRLARDKAAATDAPPHALVVAADTVVVVDGEILGKPDDDVHAAGMLRRLSGRSHEVLTGVAVRHGSRHAVAVERTTVTFRRLTAGEIDAYVATGEPRDKAGAYALQGGAGAFAVAVNGSDTNVIGLPLATLVRLAADVGVTLLPRA